MKKLAYILTFIILSVFASAGVINGGNDVFKSLEYNDNSGMAEFVMDSPKDSGILGFDYISNLGSVRNMEIEVWSTCSRSVPIYNIVKKCGKNGTCYNISEYSGSETSYFECWKPADSVPIGTRKYRIKARLGISSKGGRMGYEIDWIPRLDTGTDVYRKPEWAWWNATWNYCQNVTIINPASVLYNYSLFVHLSNTDNMTEHDIRFVNASCGSDGEILDYELEFYEENDADFWVEIPELPAGGNTVISMYYNATNVTSLQDPQAVWDINYTGVWHFANESGLIKDSSTFNQETSQGGASVDRDRHNRSNRGFLFEASATDWMNATDQDRYSHIDADYDDAPVTIEFFARPVTTSATKNVLAKYSATYREYVVTQQSDLYSYLCLYNPDGSQYECRGEAGFKHGANTSWQYYAVTYDGNEDVSGITWYVNGSASSTYQDYESGVYGGMAAGSIPLAIGARFTNFPSSELGYDGYLDEIRMSNVLRSAEYINYTNATIWNQGEYVTFSAVESYLEPNEIPVINDTCSDLTDFHNIDYSCTANASDADGESLTWYINDTRYNISSNNWSASIYFNPDVSDYNMDPCNNVTYNVTDGKDTVSGTFLHCINDTEPSISGAGILPAVAYQDTVLYGQCQASDAEGDSVTFDARIWNDTGIVLSNSSAILSQGEAHSLIWLASPLRFHNYSVECRANDTALIGPLFNSSSIQIQNYVPLFNTSIPDFSLNRIGVDYTYNGSVWDNDLDGLTFQTNCSNYFVDFQASNATYLFNFSFNESFDFVACELNITDGFNSTREEFTITWSFFPHSHFESYEFKIGECNVDTTGQAIVYIGILFAALVVAWFSMRSKDFSLLILRAITGFFLIYASVYYGTCMFFLQAMLFIFGTGMVLSALF